MVALLCGFIIGTLYGYYYRDIRDRLEKLERHKPEPEIGATPASYGHVNEYATNDAPVGISEPMTPQQLAWREAEELRRYNENVVVKQR